MIRIILSALFLTQFECQLLVKKQIEFPEYMVNRYDIKNWIDRNGWVGNNKNVLDYLPWNSWYQVNGDANFSNYNNWKQWWDWHSNDARYLKEGEYWVKMQDYLAPSANNTWGAVDWFYKYNMANGGRPTATTKTTTTYT